MITELIRRPANEQYSPKSSPRGSRSPVVPRQDSTGTLKTTISLGKTPAIVHSGPFYLMKEPPAESELTGAANLMSHYNLEHSYNKFCLGRKMKDQLSAFLPSLPGNIDTPGTHDNSSLRSLIDKPPIGGKELMNLNQNQLSGFRLHPGPLPEQYRLMNQPVKKKHKQKKNKHKSGDTPSHELQMESTDASLAASHEKKHKKQRKHDDDKERKKKKKDKKKKKQKHSPDPNSVTVVPSSNILSHTNPI
ncbi:mediator of RNA polymerase II transcription subunit 19-like protein [Leptotrombidium deliense]|uniref:Mediator of RNA polymerase II transcription subunit 19 n=1 Tax=Leptotrombidium deliense TaxID=299467 RepID=A0A443SUG2_9ACAR|nr:mediator of RNA polymerase II transcription subunit 19-like protein [Leptotrombidium deliense]